MNLANEFAAWAREPRRTNEELYLAELLIEQGHGLWKRVNKAPWSAKDYEAKVAHSKRRALIPAYRAKLDKKKLAHTVEMWAEIEAVVNEMYQDRPVRNLEALRFFPHLTKVELYTELAELSGLNGLTGLRELKLRDSRLADLSTLAQFSQLERLDLHLRWPWPALESLVGLPQLKHFDFDGNILALADVAVLPAVECAKLGPVFSGTIPLRSLEQAPAMPLVRELKLHSTASLSGLERYPLLEKLEVEGPFEDLSPIATLQQLRRLTLQGEYFSDLSPLARLPRLRTLELKREHGLDLMPLSDSPSLREVKSDCEVLKTELATLNAALGFVDVSEFLAPEPRPLKPLRFIMWKAGDPEFNAVKREKPEDGRIAAFGDDPVMRPTEKRWFCGLLKEKLKPFCDMEWVRFVDLHAMILVKLFRPQEGLRVRQMIDAVRPVQAAARFWWEIVFDVEMNGDPTEDDSERPDRDVFDPEREREEWEESQRHWKEHRDMIEREYQLGLQQQQGVRVGAEAVSAVTDSEEEETAEATAGEPSKPNDLLGQWLGTDEEDDDDDTDDDDEDTRSFMLFLNGDYVWLHASDAEDVAPILGETIEDWHAFPEPPELRPHRDDGW